MSRIVLAVAFALGLVSVAWVGAGFVGSSWIALVMTAVIGGVYVLGAFEIRQFRSATSSLAAALADIPLPLSGLGDWLGRLHPSLQNAVRLRIEGERIALPGPALTPYLVGLLVMLGMLGTFLGMVVTFKGAVFALEGSTDLHAIRAALAAPIKGLGLSFGTSVAGVAASAMLGLMSAISRRERVDAARLLDTRIATVFRPFSLVHQRQETFKALQLQAHALPDVADKLQAMMDQMERRGQQLDAQLLERQAQFHRDVTVAYTGLAGAVEKSLHDSLTASARAAGESIKPVVEAAMTEIAHESRRMHERVSDAAQAQLQGISAQFSATAGTVADTWTTALQNHARTSENLVNGLDRALAAFTDTFAQRSGALLATLRDEEASRGQAAAEVITQWRAEMTRLTERDNLALEERTRLMEKLGALLEAVNQASGAQRAAIESLVASAAGLLNEAGNQFSATAGAQAARAEDMAAQVAGSAVELSSLGESFQHGVQLFTAANGKLVESLQRIEGAMDQSMARSDEQLAYYVAQAREVIDLSIASQQGIVEDLRRLQRKPSLLAEEVL
jgi:Domain of unknown function (DUF802)